MKYWTGNSHLSHRTIKQIRNVVEGPERPRRKLSSRDCGQAGLNSGLHKIATHQLLNALLNVGFRFNAV